LSLRRFFLVRLGWALLAFWLVFTIAFVSIRVLHLPRPTPFQSDPELESYYHPEESVLELYWDDLWRFLTEGSFGSSLRSGQDARTIAFDALPATFALLVPGLALAVLLALALAVPWSRARSGARWRWRVPGYIAIGLAPFWLALLLSKHVGSDLGWFPVTGYCDFFDPSEVGCGGAVDWTRSLVLPWVTFALFFAAIYSRIIRAVLRDLRAAENADRRRSRLALVRVLGRDLGFVLGAAALVETSFGIPGVGRTVVVGVNSFEPYVVETVLVYAGLVGIGVHLLVDAVVGALDSELRAKWPLVTIPNPP
jgi:peptide/nickel transport system permease protein